MTDNEISDLDDLKAAWASLATRLQTDFARVEALALELSEDKTRSLVRR